MNKHKLQCMVDDGMFPKCVGWSHIDGLDYVGKMVVNRGVVSYRVNTSQLRVNDDVASRSQKHSRSFSNGIDFTKPNPALELLPSGNFDYVDGYGRDAGFLKLGWDDYVYDVFKCKTELARVKLRQWLNRKLPQDPNSEDDLVSSCSDLIRRNHLKPTKESLMKHLTDVEPYMEQRIKGRIVQAILDSVVGRTQEPKKITSYTADTLVSQYVRENWQEEPVYGFVNGLNTNVLAGDEGVHQGSIQSGKRGNSSFMVKLYVAFRRYQLEGIPTEYILRISGARNKGQLQRLRQELWDNIQEYMSLHPSKSWKKAISFLGFVPQHEDEDIKHLIDVDSISNLQTVKMINTVEQFA